MQWVRLRDSRTAHHTTGITTRTSRTPRACLTFYTHAGSAACVLPVRACHVALLLALGTASVDLCGVHPFLLFFVRSNTSQQRTTQHRDTPQQLVKSADRRGAIPPHPQVRQYDTTESTTRSLHLPPPLPRARSLYCLTTLKPKPRHDAMRVTSMHDYSN